MSSALVFALIVFMANSQNLRGSPQGNNHHFLQKALDAGFKTCYGVMFDAGSSGTRVYIYSWPCREVQTIANIDLKQMAPQKKVTPGIATFADSIDGIRPYLQPLIDFAKLYVPLEQLEYTPIMLGATAGMRTLNQPQQINIMGVVRTLFSQSNFLFLDPSWARVISGQEEGSYMWLSVNYLLGRIDPKIKSNKTALTIDLGGASTQIAFKPPVRPINTTQDAEIIIPNFNQYDIYSISYLGYGNDMARNYILRQRRVIGQQNIETPCYHKNYQGWWVDDFVNYTLIGTGDTAACQAQILSLLHNDDKDCVFPDNQCGINNTFQPSIDSTIEIYGTNGVQTAAQFWGLTNFTLKGLQKVSQSFYDLTWEEVLNNPQWRDDPYIASDFFLLQYTFSLLKYGYRVPEDQIINAPATIENNSPTWTLAGMFYQISQIECQFDSPICNTQRFQEHLNHVF